MTSPPAPLHSPRFLPPATRLPRFAVTASHRPHGKLTTLALTLTTTRASTHVAQHLCHVDWSFQPPPSRPFPLRLLAIFFAVQLPATLRSYHHQLTTTNKYGRLGVDTGDYQVQGRRSTRLAHISRRLTNSTPRLALLPPWGDALSLPLLPTPAPCALLRPVQHLSPFNVPRHARVVVSSYQATLFTATYDRSFIIQDDPRPARSSKKTIKAP